MQNKNNLELEPHNEQTIHKKIKFYIEKTFFLCFYIYYYFSNCFSITSLLLIVCVFVPITRVGVTMQQL